MSDLTAHSTEDDESVYVEPAHVKPTKKKRNKSGSSPAPSSGEKNLRRSGRVTQTQPRVPDITSGDSLDDAQSESMMSGTRCDSGFLLTTYFEGGIGRKRRRATKASESAERTSSPDSTPRPRHLARVRSTAVARDVTNAALEDLERHFKNSQTMIPRQRKDVDKLKQHGPKNKNRNGVTASPDTQGMLAKRDRAIDGKDQEIADLGEQLKAARSLQAASRMALDTRDKELETLKLKHRKLIQAAEKITARLGGIDELASVVEEATE